MTEGKTMASFQCDISLLNRFTSLCNEKSQTRSAVIKRLIYDWVKKQEREATKYAG